MQMHKIILIGTSHKYQTSDDNTVANMQFRKLLASLCSKHDARAIAEEMDQTALEERGKTESIACVVANEMKLEHQLSDLSPELRLKLGIINVSDISVYGFLNSQTSEQIETEIRRSNEIREQYWLRKLISLNSWPLLFVCGADHIDTFKSLLLSKGFEVVLADTDWKPTTSFLQ